MPKPLSPRQISKKETKLRRDSMVIKVISFNIGLKDRIYYCDVCGYENQRDIHSSYIIRKWKTGCGVQSEDYFGYQSNSNLSKKITAASSLFIMRSKLNSENLQCKVVENSLEAPSFSYGVAHGDTILKVVKKAG